MGKTCHRYGCRLDFTNPCCTHVPPYRSGLIIYNGLELIIVNVMEPAIVDGMELLIYIELGPVIYNRSELSIVNGKEPVIVNGM